MIGKIAEFTPKKEFLVCVDSDGCAMDTMDIKHIRCFGPYMVDEWELDAWRDPILKRWNDINLYTETRGINRFKGLAMALKEIDEQYTRIENVNVLAEWAENAKELSNPAVKAEYERTGNEIFAKVLRWSEATNRAIDALPQAEKRPFAGVSEGLAMMQSFADVAVVSSANRGAVEEEWELYGLLENVDVLLCQDAGTKADCIEGLLAKGYAPDKVLMVGDAVGDQKAAEKNGVYYYPILVRHETESWEELKAEGLRRLRECDYGAYGEKKKQEFIENFG